VFLNEPKKYRRWDKEVDKERVEGIVSAGKSEGFWLFQPAATSIAQNSGGTKFWYFFGTLNVVGRSQNM
jgi:hypothetical protein